MLKKINSENSKIYILKKKSLNLSKLKTFSDKRKLTGFVMRQPAQ